MAAAIHCHIRREWLVCGVRLDQFHKLFTPYFLDAGQVGAVLSEANRRAVGTWSRAALAVVLTMAVLTACAPNHTGHPALLEAIDAGRLDERAVQVCSVGVATLAAAIDSTTETIREMHRETPWSSEYETGLPDDNEYVAICVVEADSVAALDDALSYFVFWQSELHGSGALTGW